LGETEAVSFQTNSIFFLAVSRHHETRHETAADLWLLFPSHSVALVRKTGGRSKRLPTPCDACQKMIGEYPYIAKHNSNTHKKKYHVACALRIGLVLSDPPLNSNGILSPARRRISVERMAYSFSSMETGSGGIKERAGWPSSNHPT
jgi:hypothetical protein